MRKPTLSLLGLLVASLTLTASAHAKSRLGVIGLEAIDGGSPDSQKATASLAKWLTRGLRARASHARAQYVVAVDANKELTEVRLNVGCWEDSLNCMVKIGEKLHADRLLYGKLEKKNDEYSITLKLLNVEAKAYDSETTNVFPTANGTKKKTMAMAKTYFAEITGIPTGGTLIVRTNVDTGTLLIDDQPRGAIVGGQAKVSGLDGAVAVSVESPGYTRWHGEVTVMDGKVRRINAKLSAAKPNQPQRKTNKMVIPVAGDGKSDSRQKWRIATWTGAAITASGMIALTITGLKVRSLEKDKQAAILDSQTTGPVVNSVDDACAQAKSFMAPGTPAARVASACDSGQSMAKWTNRLITVSSLTAAVTLFFVYKAYVDTPSTNAVDRVASGQPSVVVVPVVYPDGGGVGAVIRF